MPTACDEGGFNIDLWAGRERRSAVFDWLVASEGCVFKAIEWNNGKYFQT